MTDINPTENQKNKDELEPISDKIVSLTISSIETFHLKDFLQLKTLGK